MPDMLQISHKCLVCGKIYTNLLKNCLNAKYSDKKQLNTN